MLFACGECWIYATWKLRKIRKHISLGDAVCRNVFRYHILNNILGGIAASTIYAKREREKDIAIIRYTINNGIKFALIRSLDPIHDSLDFS